VTVAANATGPLTNTVTVSGGGDGNPANNSANDPTTIVTRPDLSLLKSHVGGFFAGQVGATYTLTVVNVGTAPTDGTTVTVTDTLPPGLTATALTGTGWTCVLATRTCTRADVLAGGASYPAITLTVNVADSATGSVTNTATVSGGGDVTPGNNGASDPASIGPAPDLTIAKSHAGNFVHGKRHLEECLAIGREIGDKQRVEYALQPLGLCCLGLGEVDAGRRHLEEAVALARELGEPNELAAALNNLAQLQRTQGALDVAERLYQEVLTLATQMGNQESVAIGLMNLAMLWIERRSPERARAMLRQVHALERETGSRAGAQSLVEISAGLAALCGQWQRTARFYGAAEAMAAQTGLAREPADEAFLRPRVADAMRALGDEAFSTEEEAGRALPRDEVVEEARAWLETDPIR